MTLIKKLIAKREYCKLKFISSDDDLRNALLQEFLKLKGVDNYIKENLQVFCIKIDDGELQFTISFHGNILSVLFVMDDEDDNDAHLSFSWYIIGTCNNYTFKGI